MCDDIKSCLKFIIVMSTITSVANKESSGPSACHNKSLHSEIMKMDSFHNFFTVESF